MGLEGRAGALLQKGDPFPRGITPWREEAGRGQVAALPHGADPLCRPLQTAPATVPQSGFSKPLSRLGHRSREGEQYAESHTARNARGGM